MNTIATNPLQRLHPDDLATDWIPRGLDRISDAELLALACDILTIPREEPADSFALHAPLEVMARAELLPSVSPTVREAARQRIAHIACTWATTGTPTGMPDSSGVDDPLDVLVAGLRDGDPSTVDQAFVALCNQRDQDEVIGDLADVVLPHLGGAAHGAIFLELLPRFRTTGINPALMARTLLRNLAAHPDWQLTWFEAQRSAPAGGASLMERLLAPKADRELSNNFIYPTMSLVEESGLASEQIADATLHLPFEAARRDLLRVAAMSMIQDEPSNAPYGWSHCLTMPQAALAIANRATDSQTAIDVAATYVLGFRATQSSTPIDPEWVPDQPTLVRTESVIELDAHLAAATAWHAGPVQRTDIVQQLIDHAAPHHDAHLAKYTLACLDAGAHDTERAHLYIAAAAYLASWWHLRTTVDT